MAAALELRPAKTKLSVLPAAGVTGSLENVAVFTPAVYVSPRQIWATQRLRPVVVTGFGTTTVTEVPEATATS